MTEDDSGADIIANRPWDKHPDGSLVLHLVTGWEIFIPYGTVCGLRLHHAPDVQTIEAEAEKALPLILSPKQARMLAENLIQLADTAEAEPQPDDTQH